MNDYGYVCIRPCGCFNGFTADDQNRKQIARDVADWLRRGYTVERMSGDEIRGCRYSCPVCRPQKPSQPELPAPEVRR